jgi:hypothetical protein
VNGELEHVLAVIAQGSVWLRDGGPAPEFAEFPFVGELVFAGPDGAPRGAAEWLTALRRHAVTRLWLVLESAPESAVAAPHQLAGFVGAGSWALLAGSYAWRAAWQVGWPDAPDRRSWRVTYRGVEIKPIDPHCPDLAETEAGLRSILTDARDFCRVHDEDGWAGHFEEALRADGASRPLPDAYAPEAQRLLELADRSWVFGGMGSFNDLGFDTDAANRAYELVSAHLYGHTLAACVAAVNSTL